MTTSMPTLVAARLVAGHVDILWNQWANGPEGQRGCCPHCCGPCSALKDLLDAGQLDELYGAYVDQGSGEMETWDAEKRQVGREWLTEAWSVDLGCGPHDDDPCRCGDPNCQWNGAGEVMRALGWPDRRPVANPERLARPSAVGEPLSKPWTA